MKPVLQSWIEMVGQKHREANVTFSGVDGDDFEGFLSRMKDAAMVTDYPHMQSFLSNRQHKGVVLTVSELQRALLGLRSVMPEKSAGATLVQRVERAMASQDLVEYTGESVWETFRGVLATLQKLSRQDDSAKYWIDLLASVKITGTAITTTHAQHNKKTGNAWMAVIMLEEIFDRLAEVQKQASVAKGYVRPSSLTPKTSTADWNQWFVDEGCTDEEISYLTCPKGDNPVRVLEAAIRSFARTGYGEDWRVQDLPEQKEFAELGQACDDAEMVEVSAHQEALAGWRQRNPVAATRSTPQRRTEAQEIDQGAPVYVPSRSLLELQRRTAKAQQELKEKIQLQQQAQAEWENLVRALPTYPHCRLAVGTGPPHPPPPSR